MSDIVRLVLDVLKPHDPPLVEFTQPLSDISGVEAVSATLVEIEEDTRSLQLVVEGQNLDIDTIDEKVRDLGGAVHSVDQVVCGDRPTEFDDMLVR
ncbi:DUF211 domain-containing protein [Salinarchaeum sp. IM2453]|uniref:DUF211 domain-containing protein n=1 Tax=Salinarchaeum sp. IM2453 TaxID=2862870 RepID=UPI001C83B992|nr:DUF211 domain-containing protein [Salinarchaeum sp. IM2453]QZA89307.1 DUF211 domain-containing protein [Salinarchaeum sp. IM2453]